MTPGEKWLRLGEMYRDARALHAAGVRLRDPAATRRAIHQAWLSRLGLSDLEQIGEPVVDDQAINLKGLREVLAVLTRLGIPYAVGGSVASSLYGIDRYTRHADVTVEPFSGKERAFAEAFEPDYYVSVPAIQDAHRRRSSFNLINTATGFKVDLFVRDEQPFERSAMARRIPVTLPDAPEQPIVFHSAEDVILYKMRWYRLGHETSEQQWRDILGIFRVQAGRLDEAYLDHWAKEVRVDDLLARARQEAVV
jgi:hypothetical protein